MRTLLFLAGLVGLGSTSCPYPWQSVGGDKCCPYYYELKEGKCVRGIALEESMVWDKVAPGYRHLCALDGATMPIIHSDAENEMFMRIADSFPSIHGKNIYVGLDMYCNPLTRRLKYIDDTEIDYMPYPKQDTNFDCIKEERGFVQRVQKRDWDYINAYKDHTMSALCVRDPLILTTPAPTTTTKLTTTTKPTQPTCPPCPLCTTPAPTTTVKASTRPPTTAQAVSGPCGDYDVMDSSNDGEKPCIKFYTNRTSWDVAQQTCVSEFGSLVSINNAEENKYFFRTAVGHNIMDGVHIGAHQSAADPSVWTWIDGEVPFNGKTYDNFVSTFPIPGAGQCASMLTESSSAQWINENCDNTMQAFFCRREDFSTLPKTCPKNAPGVGEQIIPPGFPVSDIPCEYMLSVGANKLVELEIQTLLTDVDNDFLEISEGTSAANLLASFTGPILAPIKIRTARSNVMRVNWIPNGSGNNRGFRIRYYEVDP